MINSKHEQTSVVVKISIAVNTNGYVDCCIVDDTFEPKIREYQAWKNQKINDSVLWAIKTVTVHVPYPESYEDMSSA